MPSSVLLLDFLFDKQKFEKNVLILYKKYANIYMNGIQETFEALGHFLYNLEVTLKEYKNNEQLIEYLMSKNVIILDNPIKAKGHLSIWNYEENEKGANNK